MMDIWRETGKEEEHGGRCLKDGRRQVVSFSSSNQANYRLRVSRKE